VVWKRNVKIFGENASCPSECPPLNAYLVGSADQLELVTLLVDTDPNPTGPKEGARGSTGFKGALHFVHASEGLVDELLQLSRRLGGLGLVRGSHFLPEEGVVVVTTSYQTSFKILAYTAWYRNSLNGPKTKTKMRGGNSPLLRTAGPASIADSIKSRMGTSSLPSIALLMLAT